MPKKLRPFQRELKEREDDRARIERELKLRQRIYRFAELSEKERRQRFAFLIAEKQRQYLQNLSDDGELDSDSSSDAETTVQRSSTQPEENLLRTFRTCYKRCKNLSFSFDLFTRNKIVLET